MSAHHGSGLAEDLERIERIRLGRRRALGLIGAGGGALVLAGCGGGETSSSSSSSVTVGTGSSSSSSSSSGSSSSSSSSSGSTCTAYATETRGPYPGDGTNQSSGETSNVLTESGIVRSDIRSSFLSSTTTAAGIAVTFTITLADVNDSCNALEGYAIYLWHCDADGNYSLYSEPGESYLRGVQVTDENGQVTFTTIFPGCYDGRYPHMHFEVYSSIDKATNGSYALLVSQFAMEADACDDVYATSTYSTSKSNFAKITTASDNVFGDNSDAQIEAMTVLFDGNTTDGYTATATVGIAT
ncbi:dioxygenase family protein [Croceicoccus mobilis]|uniref:Intradiol ring-cleavage dioxygenases domain-containing protein n=1 Tax=Croceicoccus mobilis TaxID=1703339 RepID=A0A917DWC4_9SPHN|nr:intradiol ring-cleavage dioxygenase [Croceicoccus mobilis]GGD77746.1 hypothetical protein GCM10010990_29370 [Croceicoccus mobilis]